MIAEPVLDGPTQITLSRAISGVLENPTTLRAGPRPPGIHVSGRITC